MRACPSCSVISETEKSFCPECGTSYDRPSATAAAAANPATAKAGSPVQMLAVVGLAAYVLSWLLVPVFDDYFSWGQALKYVAGFQALSDLKNSEPWAVPNFLAALSGYTLLVIVILSSKKSS